MSSIGYNIKEIIVENIKEKQNQIKSHTKSKACNCLEKDHDLSWIKSNNYLTEWWFLT